MNIAIFGTGYVGLVTGVCFSEMGHNVTCLDVDDLKITTLKKGHSPIYEPGLETLLTQNIKAERLQFSTDARIGVEKADIIFIAVGTPLRPDGSAEMKFIMDVAETIANHMNSYKLIVIKSTVPVGTYPVVKAVIEKKLQTRGVGFEFDLASNPEFLREGSAIEDCLKPNRVVIGTESNKAKEILENLYAPFLKNGNPLLAMDPASSEMTKYAANAMLAAKISIMNEFSRVCDKLGADIEAVRKGIGSDLRIGPHFIYAGVGYGGSCFPKDVGALIYTGQQVNEPLYILEAVAKTNTLQRTRFIQNIERHLPKNADTIGIWGVAFKPGTDDIREAPSLDIIQHFLNKNFKIRVYDPIAAENAREFFKNSSNIEFFEDQYSVLNGVDALVVPTEWKSFRDPDFLRMKSTMKHALIFDGRNIYSPKNIKSHGFKYFSIGRPS